MGGMGGMGGMSGMGGAGNGGAFAFDGGDIFSMFGAGGPKG